MLLGVVSGHLGADGPNQVQDVIGVPEEELDQLTVGIARATPDTSTFSIVVTIASATSFSRALARMYASVWDVPRFRGIRAIRAAS
jgi:membrane protein